MKEKDEKKKHSHPVSTTELEETRKRAEEYLAGWKRAQADYQNLVRRTAEERKQTVEYANETLLMELLSVADNFESAWKSLPEKLKDDAWVKGIEYIKNQFDAFLEREGLTAIDTVNVPFDPTIHEAVDGKHDTHTPRVTAVIRKGYRLGNKVIRAARVTVG